MVIPDYTNYLLPYQLDWLNCNEKFAIYLKARRIGITYVEALWHVKRKIALKEDSFFVSMNEKTSSEFIRYCFLWCEVINAIAGQQYIDLSKATTSTIVMPNGSRIVALSSSPTALRGMGGSVTLDEFSFQEDDENLYISAQPVPTWSGCLRIISTANNVDTCFNRLFEDQNNPFVKFRTTLPQAVNQGLAAKIPGEHQKLTNRHDRDEAFIENIKSTTLSENAYRQEFLCEKVAWEGLVYPCFADELSPAYPVCAPMVKLSSPAVRAVGGIDWGYSSDPLAAYVGVECEDETFYVVDELYGTGIELDNLGTLLRKMQDKWSLRLGVKWRNLVKNGWFESWYCDSSRPEVASLVKLYGIPVQNKRVTQIDARLAMTNRLFDSGRVKIFNTCTNLIRELKAYTYDKNAKPSGEDHACDAISYMLSSYFYGRKISTIPNVVISAEEKLSQDVETALRLGKINKTEDIAALKRKAEDEKYAKYQIYMMNANDGDD